MPSFSQASFSKLSTCHPDLQTIFYEVIKYIDCIVITGHRNQEDQDIAVQTGHSKLQWPDGKHNASPSLAVDVSPYPVIWDNQNRFYWFAGFVMATAARLLAEGKITHQVRYGGDWNMNYEISDEQGLKDLVHFEIHKD